MAGPAPQAVQPARAPGSRGPERGAAQHSLLAYGFLRGRRYEQLEASACQKPDWDRVADLIARFGGTDKRHVAQRLAEWSEAA